MKSKIILLVISIMMLSEIVFSQSKSGSDVYFDNKGNITIGKFLQNALTQSLKKHKTDVCLISVTFAKFQVAPDSTVQNIRFIETEGTPPAFRSILYEVLLSTNKHWIPAKIDGRQVKSKTLVLPFIYQMEAGCSVNHQKVDDATSTALLTFLNAGSDAGNPFQNSYIILPPLVIFSAN